MNGENSTTGASASGILSIAQKHLGIIIFMVVCVIIIVIIIIILTIIRCRQQKPRTRRTSVNDTNCEMTNFRRIRACSMLFFQNAIHQPQQQRARAPHAPHCNGDAGVTTFLINSNLKASDTRQNCPAVNKPLHKVEDTRETHAEVIEIKDVVVPVPPSKPVHTVTLIQNEEKENECKEETQSQKQPSSPNISRVPPKILTPKPLRKAQQAAEDACSTMSEHDTVFPLVQDVPANTPYVNTMSYCIADIMSAIQTLKPVDNLPKVENPLQHKDFHKKPQPESKPIRNKFPDRPPISIPAAENRLSIHNEEEMHNYTEPDEAMETFVDCSMFKKRKISDDLLPPDGPHHYATLDDLLQSDSSAVSSFRSIGSSVHEYNEPYEMFTLLGMNEHHDVSKVADLNVIPNTRRNTCRDFMKFRSVLPPKPQAIHLRNRRAQELEEIETSNAHSSQDYFDMSLGTIDRKKSQKFNRHKMKMSHGSDSEEGYCDMTEPKHVAEKGSVFCEFKLQIPPLPTQTAKRSQTMKDRVSGDYVNLNLRKSDSFQSTIKPSIRRAGCEQNEDIQRTEVSSRQFERDMQIPVIPKRNQISKVIPEPLEQAETLPVRINTAQPKINIETVDNANCKVNGEENDTELRCGSGRTSSSCADLGFVSSFKPARKDTYQFHSKYENIEILNESKAQTLSTFKYPYGNNKRSKRHSYVFETHTN